MNAKQLLSEDKPLAQWWASVAHDARFDKICLHVSHEIVTQQHGSDFLGGAFFVMQTLSTIADAESVTIPLPSPGLDHDIDNDLKKESQAEEPKQKE